MEGMRLRSESRFPCVLFGRYRSLEHPAAMRHVSDGRHEAALHDLSLRGMSMDIGEELPVGQQLLIVFPIDDEQNDRLLAEVRWSRRIAVGYFRVGVQIQLIGDGAGNPLPDEDGCDPEEREDAPGCGRFICPDCARLARFEHSGEQILAQGSMPLYSCDECGASHAIGSLLRHSRALLNG